MGTEEAGDSGRRVLERKDNEYDTISRRKIKSIKYTTLKLLIFEWFLVLD